MFFPDGFQMPGGIVHFPHKILLAAQSAPGDGVLTGGVHHKADARHFVQQGVRIVFQLIVQLVPVEGDHLVEVDFLAAGQGADLAAVLRALRAGEDGSAELRARCKGRLLVHGVAPAQPGVAGNGQPGQRFQQADGPVPPFLLQGFLIQFPVRRQGDG